MSRFLSPALRSDAAAPSRISLLACDSADSSSGVSHCVHAAAGDRTSASSSQSGAGSMRVSTAVCSMPLLLSPLLLLLQAMPSPLLLSPLTWPSLSEQVLLVVGVLEVVSASDAL